MEETPILFNPDYRDPKGSVYSIIPSSGREYETDLPSSSKRIIDRDGAFSQSRGRMNIRKLIQQRDFTLLYVDDLFHTLVDAPTSRTIGILLFSYLTIILFYTIVYYFVSEVFNCNMDITNFIEAYFFSLETMATIGYGTRDIFFGDSWMMAIVLTSQICVKIITDGLIIGVIYCRISRPNKRASTIVFSNKAIIKRVEERLYFTFRVCELRKHQLVEAHIRCYAIRHERDCVTGDVIPFKSHPMRLNHPNDELGGMLLMCFPQEIMHELDAWSPLMPPPSWGSRTGVFNWHPPVMAHARIPSNKPISADSVGDCYDPELYSTWPGITRRTASEEPGGVWRKKRINRQVLSEKSRPITAQSEPNENTPQKSKKKKRISLGIARNIERGKSRQNYFEMFRTLAEAATLPSSSRTSLSPTPSPVPPPHSREARENSDEYLSNTTPLSQQEPSSDRDDEETGENDQTIRPFLNNTFSSSPPPLPPSYSSSYSSLSPMKLSQFKKEENDDDDEKECSWQREEKNMVMKFFDDRNIEIIVLIEGQDSTTGGVVQARHSYKLTDILWNTSFIPCVFQDELNGSPVIDFCLFHETELTYRSNSDRDSDGDSDNESDRETDMSGEDQIDSKQFTSQYQNKEKSIPNPNPPVTPPRPKSSTYQTFDSYSSKV